jgi:hypothetical protein
MNDALAPCASRFAVGNDGGGAPDDRWVLLGYFTSWPSNSAQPRRGAFPFTFHTFGWRATVDEDGHYCFAVAL